MATGQQLSLRSKNQSSPPRVHVQGVPYVMPASEIIFEEDDNPLEFWDRIVLLGGGCVIGLCVGFTLAFTLVMGRLESGVAFVGFAILVSVVNAMLGGLVVHRTRSLIRTELRKHRTDSSEDSIAEPLTQD